LNTSHLSRNHTQRNLRKQCKCRRINLFHYVVGHTALFCSLTTPHSHYLYAAIYYTCSKTRPTQNAFTPTPAPTPTPTLVLTLNPNPNPKAQQRPRADETTSLFEQVYRYLTLPLQTSFLLKEKRF